MDTLRGKHSASRSYDISYFVSAQTRIRFRITEKYGGTGEYLAIDNVQIEAGFAYVPEPAHSATVESDLLHAVGITGAGVTVAVLDTGFWSVPPLNRDTQGQPRLVAQYDAIHDRLESEAGPGVSTDENGHGTHVSATLASSERSADGSYHGVAPDAGLLSIRAFDKQGRGSYLDVIRGIEFAVSNKEVYGIRVLNMSFSAEPLSLYWDDPLNQAVMAAWQAGIVVVASAGNRGPGPMTIGVPGNVPYIITVGSLSDNYTPGVLSDDYLTAFSSTGPTLEGFVKPELIAPGGHILALMSPQSELAKAHPSFRDGGAYYMMSGTSQSTTIVSGIVALMLQLDPALTPDDVKSRLIASARPAVDDFGQAAYSVF